MPDVPPDTEGQPGHLFPTKGAEAALLGLCPRCGAKGLFAGWLKFASRCRVCGLDFTQFNVGDGPAAFLTLIIGGIVSALAIMLQLSAHPPFWVHIVLWVPITIAAVIGGLRLAKGALLVTEYRRQAAQAGNADL